SMGARLLTPNASRPRKSTMHTLAARRPAVAMPRRAAVLLGSIICFAISTSIADDWPGFHGPDGHGKTTGTLPDSWTDDDYAWRISLGSSDVGSIAITEGRAFLMAYDEARSAQTL